MSPTRHTWALAALVVVVLVVSIATPIWRKFQGTSTGLLSPVFELGNSLGLYVSNMFRAQDLARQNTQMALELAQQEVDSASLDALQQANRELRLLAGLRATPGYLSLGVEVVGKQDDESGIRYILSRGSKDGVAPGMAVVAALETDGVAEPIRYLVGVIANSAENRSTLTTTTSPLTRFAAEIAAGERTVGLAVGEYNLAVRLGLLPASAAVPVGAPVVTSNVGDYMPAGLLVGRISSLQQAQGDFFKTATVAPAAPPEYFRYLAVLVPEQAPH